MQSKYQKAKQKYNIAANKKNGTQLDRVSKRRENGEMAKSGQRRRREKIKEKRDKRRKMAEQRTERSEESERT